MKNIYLILISVVGLFGKASGAAQGQALIDSLLSEYKIVKGDTARMNLFIGLSYAYQGVNADEGLKYGNLGLELAKRLSEQTHSAYWNREIGRIGQGIGTLYWAKSDFPNALEFSFLALRKYEESKDTNAILRMYNNIGLIYQYMKEYPRALDYDFKALKLAEAKGDKITIADVLGNTGIVYFHQKDYNKAMLYYEQALKLNEELGRQMELARNYGNISLVCRLLSDRDKEIYYLTEAIKLNRKFGMKKSLAINFTNLAGTYYFAATDSVSGKPSQSPGKRTAILKMAKACADSAIQINKEIGELLTLIDSYQNLTEINIALGDYVAALESYRNQTLFKDSVFNIEKDKKQTQTAMQYEFDKKEAHAKAEQDKKDIRQKNIRNSIGGGLAGALIFLVVVYRQRNKISKEKKRSDELLLNILPAETAEELKKTGFTKAKDFNEVTVLFTDFKNFTAISGQMSAQELVNEINFCYSAFDEIIGRFGIEKIKTIGDSYMCAGGLPVANKTNAVDTVRAALAIRDFMLEEKKKRESSGKPFFEIRIGCNTGPVVAGIVGIKKFAYDIWGDAVNIASRMESSSEAGKVNISESTFLLVRDKFKCEHRGMIEVRNKGMIDMYFVIS